MLLLITTLFKFCLSKANSDAAVVLIWDWGSAISGTGLDFWFC